ncbi:MAG: hypothetical protein NZ703_04290 [Gemmataceae bacterium]|nr:hypothetical protein [Gemmataceae bacterium]MCS7270282.1 hypothetical protein [Gemmataceae bacterium]
MKSTINADGSLHLQQFVWSRRLRQCLWLLGLLVAVMSLIGCQKQPPAGGANHRTAEKARRQAEQLAEAALTGALQAYARTQPSAVPQSRWQRWWTQVRQSVGLTPAVSTKLTSETLPLPVEPPVVIQPVSYPSAELRPKSPPRPGPPPVIRERVVNRVPRPSEEDAEEDALAVAAELLTQRFAALNPPLEHRPTIEEVRLNYLRASSREVIPFRQRSLQQDPRAQQLIPVLEKLFSSDEIARLVDVEFDIEVTGEQIRVLRSRQRVETVIRVMGIFVLVLLATFLLLNLYAWTKGYMTRFLWLILIIVVVCIGGMWWFFVEHF